VKIIFICIGSDIQSIGFRKMASLARSIHPHVEVGYIVIANPYAHINVFQKSGEVKFELLENDLEKISAHLAKAYMVCFSSMTMYAKLTKEIITKIRSVNEKTFIVWGGIHPIVHPEDAIRSADAICVGEGESAFKEFLLSFRNGNDYTGTRNFWFNIKGKVIKNNFLSLHNGEDMNNFPLPLYAEDELVYERNKGFMPLDFSKYISYNSLTYNTIWSIGCPYKCIYCSNSKFIENDGNYRKVRYPSVDYVISEIKSVLKKHAHLSTIVFHDDSFMAIPINQLREFAKKWKNEIGLPFCVLGIIPSFVERDKIELLIWAGMYRVRMGIQSGSNRILKFYKRPNKPGLIERAAASINEFADYMVPPGYDIIVDCPIETREDVIDTLDMLYRLPRPYILNIFALRVIPNTVLSNELSKLGVSHPGIESNDFTYITPTLANVMVHLLAVLRPPKKMYEFLLKYIKVSTKEQLKYPLTLHTLRLVILIKVLIFRMRFMDFPGLPGKMNFLVWKLGIVRFWQVKILKRSSRILVKLDSR